MKNSFTYLVLMLCLSASMNALHSEWTRTGAILGADVRVFAETGSFLFVGTALGKVYRSDDNGDHWEAADRGLPRSPVTALAVSGSRIFAGTVWGGVFVSIDQGGTWTEANTGLPKYFNVCSLTAIGEKLYAGTSVSGGWEDATTGGFFVSTDNGASWKEIDNGLPQSVYVLSVACSGTSLIAGTSNGIYRSADNGEHWARTDNGTSYYFPISDIVVSGASIIAPAFRGVMASTDDGAHWYFPENAGMQGMDLVALTKNGIDLFAVAANQLYRNGTRSSGGVFVSSTNGATWELVNSGLTDAIVHRVFASRMALFVGTDRGIFRSTDHARTWTPVNAGVTNKLIHQMFSAGSEVFVGTANGELFSSQDKGMHWELKNGNVTHAGISEIARSGDALLFGTWENGVFRTVDGGVTWARYDGSPVINGVYRLASLGTHVVAGIEGSEGSGLFLSTDAGVTWNSVREGITDGYINCLSVYGTSLYAGTESGFYSSADSGRHWTKRSEMTYGISHIARSRTHLFAVNPMRSVIVSTDNGATWSDANAGLPDHDVFSLAVYDTCLYAATRYGVYCSADNGSKWVSVGLEQKDVPCLAICGTDLYAAAADGVVWRMSLTGEPVRVETPAYCKLEQNYPNPFNPSTTISFSIPASMHVTIHIYDVLGQLVATPFSEDASGGTHSVEWDASGFPSGVYFCRLLSGRYSETKRLILLR